MRDHQRQTFQNGHSIAAAESLGNGGAAPARDLLDGFGKFRRPFVRGMPVGGYQVDPPSAEPGTQVPMKVWTSVSEAVSHYLHQTTATNQFRSRVRSM